MNCDFPTAEVVLKVLIYHTDPDACPEFIEGYREKYLFLNQILYVVQNDGALLILFG
jgi:hypothetical protein